MHDSLATADRPFVGTYTAFLVAMAFLCGVVAWVEVGMIEQLEAEGLALWATVIRIDQVVAVMLVPASLMAAVARHRRWPMALVLTRVVSIVFSIIVPIGTALFIYWLVSVRPREAQKV